MIQIPGLAAPSETTSTPHNVAWSELIPEDQWNIYRRVLRGATEQGLLFALGGGLAFSHYSNRWRNTKDIDLYVLPRDKERMIAIVHACGLEDYYAVHDYDRKWIYRSHKGETIVDIIWQMANYRSPVDEQWLTRGEEVRVHGTVIQLLPPEELMWAKLYVLQRERCDWGDLLNILYNRGPSIDWKHLLERVGPDQRLLAALISIFAWTCPGVAQRLPAFLWETLRLPKPEGPARDVEPERIRLLDTRDWFGPNQSQDATDTFSLKR